MPRLGINVDHVATVREARQGENPDPVTAGLVAELAGADNVTVHLRVDRRHVQERDVRLLRQVVKTSLNLEMAPTFDMVETALEICPDTVCLVPEERDEVTTEGGLDVVGFHDRLSSIVSRMKDAGIRPGVFIEPVTKQIQAADQIGADHVELHTGSYAEAQTRSEVLQELRRLVEATEQALKRGLEVHAGHGLDYDNVGPVVAIQGIEEVSIGHAIVSKAVFVGFEEAVREMVDLVHNPIDDVLLLDELENV